MDAIIVVSEDQSGSSDCDVLFGTSKAAKWFRGLTKMRNDQLPFQAKVLPQNLDTRLKAKTWQSRR